jgi:hypothetical protein
MTAIRKAYERIERRSPEEFVKKVEGFAFCGPARDSFLKPESGKVRCDSGAVPQL